MYGTQYSDGIASAVYNSTSHDMLWVRADYLHWQLTGTNLPVLATRSPGNTAADEAGILPDAEVLAGGGTAMNGWRSGWQIQVGYYLDPVNGWALTGDYFDTGRDSFGFEKQGNTNEFIARPYFDTQHNAEAALLINGPGEFTAGRLRITAFTDFLSAGAALQTCLLGDGGPLSRESAQLNGFAGYRFYHHDTNLLIQEAKVGVPNNPPNPSGLVVARDQFTGRNEFNGFEFGLQGNMQRDKWQFESLAALALGANHRDLSISGGTAGAIFETGNLLTSGLTNIGRYDDTQGVVIPRFRLGVGCQLTERLNVHLGYNLVIWDNVVQAGDNMPQVPAGALSPAVDPRNVPITADDLTGGGPDPAFPGFREKTVVAHGMDLGLDVRF